MKTHPTEERMKECESRRELGDPGGVAGGGVENQDQEVRAQKYRRELGEEETRHRRRECVSVTGKATSFAISPCPATA